jgi:Protein of unknown function (DUF3501)
MPRETGEITANDILPMNDYVKIRKDKREENVLRKKLRRLHVGPFATVLFENYDTMWMQVQEMLYIEKGGDEQLADELRAYNPMIPSGSELTCTLMFEIEDELTRRRVLGRLGNVEDAMFLLIGDDRVRAVPEQDVERTNDAGKASSVHFLHFPLTAGQKVTFGDLSRPVMFAIEHENYGHLAIMPETMRLELMRDLAD